jgi:hypothetical protein
MDGGSHGSRDGSSSKAQAERKTAGWHVNLFMVEMDGHFPSDFDCFIA